MKIGYLTTLAVLTAALLPRTNNEAKANNPKHICMVRVTTGASGGDSPFTVVVQRSKRSAFSAQGYRKTQCKGQREKLARYRQQVCEFARVAPGPVQQDFKRTHGVTPTKLCKAVS